MRDYGNVDFAMNRANLSRETLYKYRWLQDGTGDEPAWLLTQIQQELVVLSEISAKHPSLASALDLLSEAWQDFAQQLKRKAH